MTESRKLQKVPWMENSKCSHRRVGTVRHRRKETNDEVMHQAILYKGRIRINMQFRILHPHTGTYAGWQGAAFTLEAPSISTAKEFRAKLHEAISPIARALGLRILV